MCELLVLSFFSAVSYYFCLVKYTNCIVLFCRFIDCNSKFTKSYIIQIFSIKHDFVHLSVQSINIQNNA